MTTIERRLFTCRLLKAMSRNPELASKLSLKDVSIQTVNRNKKGEKHGKVTQI